MSKTRVYELAQQMGIDNKELMARLAALGVPAMRHDATAGRTGTPLSTFIRETR